MQHLSTERLAALADETPTPEEAAHLARCLACRRERDVYLALLDLARREGGAGVEPGALAAVGEPVSSWDAIATGLRAEGLIDETIGASPARPARAARPVRERRPVVTVAAWWRQAAAASVLLVAGVGVGRATAGRPVLPAGVAPRGANVPAQTATPTSFADVSEATVTLARAQRDYQRAAAFLAEHDTTALVGGSEALRARLAALDEVIPRVQKALYDAPEDPVLSQYYQASYEARESTLRQLGRTLPTGVRITGF